MLRIQKGHETIHAGKFVAFCCFNNMITRQNR